MNWHLTNFDFIFLILWALIVYSPYIVFGIGLALLAIGHFHKRSTKVATLIFAMGAALVTRELLLRLFELIVRG
jgi:hypothetical protein